MPINAECDIPIIAEGKYWMPDNVKLALLTMTEDGTFGVILVIPSWTRQEHIQLAFPDEIK
jgi:putative N-acetylmannosamine-6-phosphate epimerase